MRHTALAALTIALCLGMTATVFANTNTTLPMHTRTDNIPGTCEIGDVCADGTIQVNTNDPLMQAVYLLARNYTDLAGVQTAFDFGGWAFVFGIWDCQVNQLFSTQPGGAGGPIDGTITTAFDCVLGGDTTVIGRMFMTPISGCVTQIESGFPFETHVVSCANEIFPVDPLNRGSVCVGSGGYDACLPATPVETTTWSEIKGQYR